MKFTTKLLFSFLIILVAGYAIPERVVMPVMGATSKDWNKDTFWYEPWGRSGVHKGIDIFARNGTDLVSTTDGVVLFQGSISLGGNVVLVLGPKWRLHYYAHLKVISVNRFDLVSAGQTIGSVGDTGNARGKPAHLHYSIITLVPYFWKATDETQGWKKMFFIDSGAFLKERIPGL